MRINKILPVLALAALASLAIPAEVFAQLPTFTTLEGTVKGQVRPLFRLARYFIVGIALLAGMWQAYKATQGGAQGWVKAILLWVVAGIAIAPAGFFNMLGMTNLAKGLNDWGL